jgi:5-oxoprolinase (ATP-hydrolysing)
MGTAVYELSNLRNGHKIEGPAIIIDKNWLVYITPKLHSENILPCHAIFSTILVEPNCRSLITPEGNVLIKIQDSPGSAVGTELDPIQLSIFSHRFMSIAEQMGTALQRSAISTNIKVQKMRQK